MGVSPTNIPSRRSEESKPRVSAEALKYENSIHDSQDAMISPPLLLVMLFVPAHTEAQTPRNPNILLIYLDELGYGDVNCLNPDSKNPNPRLDRIAREGFHFTDAHCVGSVCRSRHYALLSGRYPWRRGKGAWATGRSSAISM